MLKSFNQYISESSSDKYLLYYSFDWDDNVLDMSTPIHMEELVDGKWVEKSISTSFYANVRDASDKWRLSNNNPEKAFSEFRDDGLREDNAFLLDVKEAISKENYGPSWQDFKECLTNGSIFSIITARGHERESIIKGVSWIIDNILTEEELYLMYNNLLKFAYLFNYEKEYERVLVGIPTENELVKKYLKNCEFIGVSSPSRGGITTNTEVLKGEALLEFKNRINAFSDRVGIKAILGFSDDDLKNAKHIEDLIANITKEKFPNIIKYVVKRTKNPDNVTKTIKKFDEEISTPGKESSVLSLTQFGNMTSRLYPQGPDNRQDDFANQHNQQTEYLAKLSKELVDKRRELNKEFKGKKSRKSIDKNKNSKKEGN